MIFSFSADFSYNPGLTSLVVSQSSKFFKIWYFSHENRGLSVDNYATSNGFNSRVRAVLLLTFTVYMEKFILNVKAELTGKLDNWTKLYWQSCVLNTCAATLTFKTKYDVPCVRWMYSYAICKYTKIWLCKQIFKYEKILHVLLTFTPYSLPEKEYKTVLGWKVFNLKSAGEEEVNLFLEWWVQLFIVKFSICY